MQERVQIPGNSRKFIISKTSEKRLKIRKFQKNKTSFTLTTLKVVRVKVVLFFIIFPLLRYFSDVFLKIQISWNF